MCGEKFLVVMDYLGMNIDDKATIVGRVTTGIVVFSLKATEKMFEASNILFDAYKLKCYN